MALYHRCHYNSSGRLFDVRLGTDGSAVCDGPNPAQWTGVTLSNGNRLEFRSREMQRVIDALIMRMILGGDILFRGETGTGKDLMARLRTTSAGGPGNWSK